MRVDERAADGSVADAPPTAAATDNALLVTVEVTVDVMVVVTVVLIVTAVDTRPETVE